MTRWNALTARTFRLALPALVAAVPVFGQARIRHDGPEAFLPSRGVWNLTVEAPGAPRVWTWTTPPELEALGARFEVLAPTSQARFHAPTTLVEHTFVLRATAADDPGLTTTLAVRVVPHTSSGGERGLVQNLFPDAFEPPQMRAFFGDVNVEPGQTPPHPFQGAEALAFVQDEAMGDLDRHWLVSDVTGIHAISLTGKVTAETWLPKCARAAGDPDGEDITALAVRPAGSRPEAPPLVYGLARRVAGTYSKEIELYALRPGGKPRRLGEGTVFSFRGGPLAIDRAGNVFVGQKNRIINRISPDGHTTVLAGGGEYSTPPYDGTGAAARFQNITALVVDPATGDLYVADECYLRRVTPEGVVTTPLVWPKPQFREAAATHFARPPVIIVEPGITDDGSEVEGLALRGRELFMAFTTRRTLKVYYLDTHRMVTLVPGSDSFAGATRLGPIHHLFPGVPLAESAKMGNRLFGPGPIALNPNGMCVLGMGAGLLEVDLPDGPVTGVGAATGPAAPPAPAAAGPAAPPAPAAAGPAAPPAT